MPRKLDLPPRPRHGGNISASQILSPPSDSTNTWNGTTGEHGQDTEVKVSKPMAQGHSKKHQAVEDLEGKFRSAVTARKPCFLLAPSKPKEC